MIEIKLRKYFPLIICFLAITTLFLSCKNKDVPPATPAPTALNVINAGADTINYYVNGTRQNNLSSLYPQGATGYTSVLSGAQNYQFKKAGSAVALFGVVDTLILKSYYSIFVTGETADKAFKTIDSLGAASTILSADTTFTTCMLRFIDASPNAGSLNVNVGKGDTLNLKNRNFKFAGPFTKFTAGAKEVKISSSTASIDTTLTLQSGSIYSLFTYGIVNGTGGKTFSVKLIINR